MLAAHGVGSDAKNEHWMNVLDSLTDKMSKDLEGLEFAYGKGFAPHELFDDWVRAQIEAGMRRLRGRAIGESRQGTGESRKLTGAIARPRRPRTVSYAGDGVAPRGKAGSRQATAES